MYLTNVKIKREGEKPINEQHVVSAISLTDVEVKITEVFQGEEIEITSCKVVNFTEIFELGNIENTESLFFEIKLELKTLDDKIIKELYLQEATDEPTARSLFATRNIEGDIVSFVKKPYKSIIR